MAESTPSFEIPARPERHFSGAGGLEYRGGSVFRLSPTGTEEEELPDADLVGLVDAVLRAGPYQYADFHDLPMPFWLVRDRETGDAFRVAVRDGEIRLHVLPRTEPPGLQAFYERLGDREGAVPAWDVTATERD